MTRVLEAKMPHKKWPKKQQIINTFFSYLKAFRKELERW